MNERRRVGHRDVRFDEKPLTAANVRAVVPVSRGEVKFPSEVTTPFIPGLVVGAAK